MTMRVLDPRVFITPPFTECPKCHKMEFGVLMVNGNGFVKRCRSCRFDTHFDLPALTKKIIYLDQFVVSEMMKSINPASPAFTKEGVKFYRYLYEKLDRLSKLQLVVCPYSQNHHYESLAYESLISGSYEALKQVYHQLSHGLHFHFPEEIRQDQIYRNVMALLGQDVDETDVSEVINGEVHDWQDRLIITANVPYNQVEADEITTYRDAVAAGLNACFQNWQKETGTGFEAFYQRELDAFGRSILQQCARDMQRFRESAEQGQVPDLGFALSSNYELIMMVKDVLLDAGVPEEELSQKLAEYFLSDAIKEVPCVQISAMLYAGLAHQAANGGRTNLPNQGMQNDIEVLASYTPYCDAIFVDSECYSLLKNVPHKSAAGKVKTDLGIADKVFSPRNKDEFLEFLDSIEKSASTEHLQLVEQVYGPDWAEPYTTMFDRESD